VSVTQAACEAYVHSWATRVPLHPVKNSADASDAARMVSPAEWPCYWWRRLRRTFTCHMVVPSCIFVPLWCGLSCCSLCLAGS